MSSSKSLLLEEEVEPNMLLNNCLSVSSMSSCVC